MARPAARTPAGSASPSQGVVIVVAVYNNEDTIMEVLLELEGSGLPIIVVDDGSDDGTAGAVDSWSDDEHDPPRRTCRLAVNSGKAAAMRAGFEWARELGFSHALTFDADGQHDASRINAFLSALESEGPDVLVVGSREPLARGYPLRNRIGRLTSNLAIRAQCGVAHGDVPCGMRIYPLARVKSTSCLSGRFAWEEEFITRAVWSGCRVASVCIPSVYAPAGKRRSHYRFRRDWPEGIVIFAWLLLLACVPSLKPNAWRRHLHSFLCGQNAGLGRSMAASTERLFLSAGMFITSLLAILPLPLSWVIFLVIAWLGLAWNVPGLILLLMVGAYGAGFAGTGVSAAAFGAAVVVGIILLVSALSAGSSRE